MAEISEEAKKAMVIAHARFVSPAEIRTMLREEFGEEVEIKRIHAFNPAKSFYAASAALRELWELHRKTYMEDISSHDIASPAYRIGMLDKMAKDAQRKGNMKLAAELAEQAAKEVGGLYTNERRISGSVEHRHRPATVEDARQELKDRLERARQANAVTGQDAAPSSDTSGQHGANEVRRA